MAKANRMANEREQVVYTGANGVKINALADVNTVWLNRQQLAVLFGRDVKTIGKHIANALKEELLGMATVAKFATVQTEGERTVTRHLEVGADYGEGEEEDYIDLKSILKSLFIDARSFLRPIKRVEVKYAKPTKGKGKRECRRLR